TRVNSRRESSNHVLHPTDDLERADRFTDLDRLGLDERRLQLRLVADDNDSDSDRCRRIQHDSACR
ncbi:MAG: hypothetical protein ACK55I_11060, partial [bacterium]